MSDSSDNAKSGIISSISGVITSLPKHFTALLFINAIFIVGLFWFAERLATLRATLITQLIESCASHLGK